MSLKSLFILSRNIGGKMNCRSFTSCNALKVLRRLFLPDITSFLDKHKVKYGKDDKYIEVPTEEFNDDFINRLYEYGLVGEGWVRIRYVNFIYLWILHSCDEEVNGR